MATSSLLTLASIGAVQLLAVMSPGPSFLITARTAVAQSRLDGIKVALGLGAGTVIWSAAAVLGLTALFHALPAVFLAMKLAGAVFLIYIAVMIFRHADVPLKIDGAAERLANPFLKGFFTQLSNPKVAVFFGSIFFAMLPDQVPLWMSLALICLMSFNEVWWYSAVSLFFGAAPVRRFYIGAKKWIDRVTGLFLAGLGLRLFWQAAREV